MKLKKALSICMVGAMAAALLAGCGNSSEEGSTADNAAVASADAESTEETGAEDESTPVFDEMQYIEGYGMSFMGDAGWQEVEDAVNAISEAAINVHLTYHPMDVATYMEQMGLMLSGGEAFDLIQMTAIPVVSFSTMSSQNELMDITDLVDEYAPDVKELLGDFLDATTVDGKLYGLPNYKSDNSSYYMVMRKDILDELGLTEKAENATSWTEIEEIMYTVNDNLDSLPEEMQVNAVIGNSDAQGTIITNQYINVAADSFDEDYGFEVLADSTRLIYVDEDGVVQNNFATDGYRTAIERVHKWYEDGLVYKDAATSDETGDTLLANGLVFCYPVMGEIGCEVSKENTTGYDLVLTKYCDVPVQTSNVNSWGWAVPVTSENPEAAVAFLNLWYTNADIENLFVYGIEGRDYELLETGEAQRLEDCEYQCEDFLFPNQFNAYPAAGMGGNFREVALQDMEDAEVSPYLGIAINTDPIANEITAVNNVLSKYEAGLESGTSDPAMLDDMLAELEQAGAPDVIAYYQEQLDAWVAAQ